jgi:hypothetical protein
MPRRNKRLVRDNRKGMRKHTNNKGYKMIKSGATSTTLKQIAKRLNITYKEDTL